MSGVVATKAALKLYRVENQNTMQGLWYDRDGNFNPFIKKLSNAKCGDLPMPKDCKTYKYGGTAWFSACDNIPDMKNWFSIEDLRELSQAGYHLYEFQVKGYHQVPGHAIFTREDVIVSNIIDFNILQGV